MCVTIYIKYFRGLVEVGGEEVSFIKVLQTYRFVCNTLTPCAQC